MNKKMIVVATLGTVLEWAEFTYYIYIALIIAAVFFSGRSEAHSVLGAFVVFALGYLLRPLGAVLFGHFGDQSGRQHALQYSIVLMGLSTLAMGCLPGARHWGDWSPALLLFLRCIQSIAVSGEFNGASVFLLEHNADRPFYAASWSGCAAALGMAIGSLFAVLVSLPGLPNSAWRLPLILGSGVCWCGMVLRRRFIDTPDFLSVKDTGVTAQPMMNLWRDHRGVLLACFALCAVFAVYFYVCNIYYVTNLIEYGHQSAVFSRSIVTAGTILSLLFIPVAGDWADRWGPRPILVAGLVLAVILGPTLFYSAGKVSWLTMSILELCYAIGDALLFAPIFGLIVLCFPVHVRYTGASLAWNAAMAIFGGTAPLVCMLLHRFHYAFMPGVYVSVAAVFGLLLVVYCPKLRHTAPAAP